MSDRAKPGRVDEGLDGKHSHLNQASPGHGIDVSDLAKPGHVDDQSHSIEVSDQVEPGYVDNQSHLDQSIIGHSVPSVATSHLGQPRPRHAKDTSSVDHSNSDQINSGHEVGTLSVTTLHSIIKQPNVDHPHSNQGNSGHEIRISSVTASHSIVKQTSEDQ